MAGLGDLTYRSVKNDGGPTYRMSMLPFGTYANPDGTESLGLAVPGMIQEPINALMRLAENSRLPDGRLGIPNPDNAQNREDVLTGLLSMYGNAMNPGRLMKGAAAKAAPEAAREAPYTMYRGAPNADGLFPTDRPLFMSSSPDVAGTYAGMFPGGPGVSLDDWTKPAVGSVAPMRADFANPLVVDAQGRAWNDIPFNGNWIDSNALSYWARDAGHDGLVIKNVTDHLGAPGSVAPADTVVALKRGTVSSPLTGETLYSDTGKPSLFGSAIAGSEHPIGHMPSDLIEQVAAAGTIPYAGVGQLSSTDTLVHQLMANSPTVSVKTGERRAGTNDRQGPPLTAYETTALDQAWRDKIRRTGELYSDTGLPSIWGGALAPQQDGSFKTSYASGGNVADTSGLSGLRAIPDYGFGPMTPTTVAGYPNDYLDVAPEPRSWLGTAADIGSFPARAYVNQIDAAGTGIADAMLDPSLANITNAGVQTGMALMSPTLTTVSGLGGLGLAALRDANFIPSADAKNLRRPSPQPVVAAPSVPEPVDPVFEKIKDDPSLIALYQQIKAEQNNATRDYPGRNGDASRAEAAGRVKDLQGQFAAALAQRDAAKQGIYDQQVLNANSARDIELGRDRRFSDTEVGKVYDKLGGYAPLVAGFLPGVVSRLAYGPAKTLGSALIRDAEGATFGIGANNVPLVYNSFSTEVDNPEQRAYEAYAYGLPDGHPDKIKAQEMADRLPKLNPIREQAQEELYDLYKFAERAGMGAFEGWGGNRLGQMVPSGLGGIFRRSSYQLTPEAGVAVKPIEGAKLPALQEDAAALHAGNDAALRRSSRPVDPASGYNLPALGDAVDTVPASPVAGRKPSAGRRSKSVGSKGQTKPEKTSSASDVPPATPDKEAAASDELKRFFGSKQAPDLRDLKATGGAVDGAGSSGKVHSGPLHSELGGRTDSLPVEVSSGSYIIPADIVSALGEGNTSGGIRVLQDMFPEQPKSLHYASGGSVPIMAAGGEHVLSPEQVAALGGGDLNVGHQILDEFVKRTRNETIRTLKSLPGPQK